MLIYLSPYSFGRKQQHSNNGVVIRHSGGGCNIRSPYSGLSNAIVIRSQYWYRLTLNRKLPDSVMIEYVVDYHVRELVVFFHSEVVKSCSREKKLLKEHTSEVTVNLGFVLEKCHLNLR